MRQNTRLTLVDIHAASANVSPEAGLGADDEAAAVLVEVGKLELGTRCVVVRGHVHGVAGLSLEFRHLSLHTFLHCLTSLHCISCAPDCKVAR